MIMNIEGTWTYHEDFEYGTSTGMVKLTQKGNEVEALFSFTEQVEDDYCIKVEEQARGGVKGNKLVLKSLRCEAYQGDRPIEYLPNNYEIYLTSATRLVGSTYDEANVCGVFVLEKMEEDA